MFEVISWGDYEETQWHFGDRCKQVVFWKSNMGLYFLNTATDWGQVVRVNRAMVDISWLRAIKNYQEGKKFWCFTHVGVAAMVSFVEMRCHWEKWHSRGVLSWCWWEVSGFEDFDFEALVRGLDENTQWPIVYTLYLWFLQFRREREIKVGSTYLKTTRW